MEQVRNDEGKLVEINLLESFGPDRAGADAKLSVFDGTKYFTVPAEGWQQVSEERAAGAVRDVYDCHLDRSNSMGRFLRQFQALKCLKCRLYVMLEGHYRTFNSAGSE